MKKTDFLWLFAYPLYQIIGTFRHEASHALAAWLGGAQIDRFVFWPTIHETGGFMWGYVTWSGDISWITHAAPYLFDLITYLVFFVICMRFRFPRRWLWINAIAIGLISPFINSIYNYWGGLSSMNDVGKLLLALPTPIVHFYFILTLLGYLIGLILVLRASPTTHKTKLT
jgi:hypothetical protein